MGSAFPRRAHIGSKACLDRTIEKQSRVSLRRCSLGFGVILSAGHAFAQAAPPITDSKYTLEYFQGPVTSSSRVMGLAGAFAALAEGCEGEYSNAASPAVRPWYSLSKLDYDICLGFTAPGAFGGTDFENAGRGADANRFKNSATLNVGLQLVYGLFGATVLLDTFSLALTTDASATTTIAVNRVTSSIATSFLDGHLLVGIGFRSLVFQGGQRAGFARDDASLFNASGTGLQVGAVFMPTRLPLRLGATFRDRIHIDGIQGNPAESMFGGNQVAAGLILPERVIIPAEIEVGAAIEFGRRVFNPDWVDPTTHEDLIRARYERKALEREGAYAKILDETREADRNRKRAELERRDLEMQDREKEEMNKEIQEVERLRRERTKLYSRKTAILHLDLLYTAPVGSTLIGGTLATATSITGFAEQKKFAYGDATVGFFSPRVALETEVIPMWLILRGGTYMEPSLYDQGHPRAHLTGGFDFRLIRFNPWGLFGESPWRFRFAFDGAPRYTNFGFSIGKYH